MVLVNEYFLKLLGSYLFLDIVKKVNIFKIMYLKWDIIWLGIGDVICFLFKVCIEVMYKVVEEMILVEIFCGYGFE